MAGTLPDLEVHYATTIEEAIDLLAEGSAQAAAIAGGTDLLVRIKQRTTRPRYLVKLNRIPALASIQFDPMEGLKVGAATRLVDVVASPVVQEHYSALATAASLVGAVQHQNMGTIGGNICQSTRCWYFNRSDLWRRTRGPCLKTGGDICHAARKLTSCSAVYQGDVGTALVALGAHVEIAGPKGTRRLPLEELFTGDGQAPHSLQPGELLTTILVSPPGAGERTVYLKHRLRQSIDFPLVAVAGWGIAEGGRLSRCRLAVAGLGPAPSRLRDLEEVVAGSDWDWEPGAPGWERIRSVVKASFRPVENVRAKPGWRMELAATMLRKALLSLARGSDGTETSFVAGGGQDG